MERDALHMAKNILEDRLRRDISHSLKLFKQSTGLTPSSINIDMVNVTEIEDNKPQFVMGLIKVELEDNF